MKRTIASLVLFASMFVLGVVPNLQAGKDEGCTNANLRLNPDNVQEYCVVTHNATPEYGRNSGAQVAIATRSGTNDYHGDVYWFHRNTALNANDWFNNAAGIKRPTLLLNQFGADMGGPIIKNETFFFASYQGNRIAQTQPIAAAFRKTPSVYTASLKSGLFRYFIPDPANPLVINGVTITRNSPLLVDSKTGTLKPGVTLCGAGIARGCVATYNIFTSDPLKIGADPTIAGMVGAFPLPNTFNVGDGLNFGGFEWNPPSRFVGPHNSVRLDYKLNDNARPAVFPGFGPIGEVFRTGQNLAVSYRRVFSPNLVNEFTTGYSRFRFFFSLRESNSRGGVETPPYGQGNCFGPSSFQTIDTPFCNTAHAGRAVSNIQFIDNLSYVRGAHSIRTGFNIRFYRNNEESGAPGRFQFVAYDSLQQRDP